MSKALGMALKTRHTRPTLTKKAPTNTGHGSMAVRKAQTHVLIHNGVGPGDVVEITGGEDFHCFKVGDQGIVTRVWDSRFIEVVTHDWIEPLRIWRETSQSVMGGMYRPLSAKSAESLRQ